MNVVGERKAKYQVEALGEDVIELANLSLELKRAAVKAGQDRITAASSIAVTVSIAIPRADIADTIVVACMTTLLL